MRSALNLRALPVITPRNRLGLCTDFDLPVLDNTIDRFEHILKADAKNCAIHTTTQIANHALDSSAFYVLILGLNGEFCALRTAAV
ncbi:MAG: hypothetical protein CVV07_14730 [Gammaproteobacteria bacterium HGW-Gammaproteobacteria-11]|nr:MAG: hypothetical protein CVV07_14730 [Gammaproteobacteria bacterium HGW-Gammaproteobacteria-11]